MKTRFPQMALALTMILIVLSPTLSQTRPQRTRIVTEGAAESIEDVGVSVEDLRASVANPSLFNQTTSAHQKLSSIYQLNTKLLFYDDSGGNANAFATRDPATTPGPDGSILFGENFLTDLAKISKKSIGNINVAIFCFMAHELAHIIQIKNNSTLRGKERELQADYIAGWGLAQFAKSLLLSDKDFDDIVYEASTAFFTSGDYNKTSSTHHGVKRERQVTILKGIEKGSLSMSVFLSTWTTPPSNLYLSNKVEIGSTGYIPELLGRLNPILDSSGRTYLYADNIAVEGGKFQPFTFEINKPFSVEDSKGSKFTLKVIAITKEAATIEYAQVSGVTTPTNKVTGIVKNSAGAFIADAQVFFMFKDGTYIESESDRQGKIKEVELKSKVSTVFCAHPEYPAVVLQSYDAASPLSVTLTRTDSTGSVVIHGTGFIPGLQGRLNPIMDSQGRIYLYATNIAIEGGKPQPFTFEVNKPFFVEDSRGGKFMLKVIAMSDELATIEFTRIRSAGP